MFINYEIAINLLFNPTSPIKNLTNIKHDAILVLCILVFVYKGKSASEYLAL